MKSLSGRDFVERRLATHATAGARCDHPPVAAEIHRAPGRDGHDVVLLVLAELVGDAVAHLGKVCSAAQQAFGAAQAHRELEVVTRSTPPDWGRTPGPAGRGAVGCGAPPLVWLAGVP